VQMCKSQACGGAMPSILIIDDDDSLRDSLRRTLHKEGYTIMDASEGGRGLKQLGCSPVDLVLLDMFMPEKDGLETIGELHRTHPGIRIIAMSGGGFNGTVDVLHVAKKLGARRTLAKPFTREQLLDAVREELLLH
jgi:DNA-binding NtrC family response regulator